MRLTVGLKIGGGLFLVTLMLIVAGGVGFGGAVKLGGVVDYFANKAWTSGESASALISSVQKQASTVGVLTKGVSGISNDQRKALESTSETAAQAIDGLAAAGIATPEQIESLKALYSKYQSSQSQLISEHSAYVAKRSAAFEDFGTFNRFMKVLEFYSKNVYRLPNVDQSDKFDLITMYFRTKLALQTRFYYMQRLLGGDDPASMKDELEGAMEELDEESAELADLDLTDSEMRSGEFAGKTYADYLTESIKTHQTTFEALVTSYDKFKNTQDAYEQVRINTLSQVEKFVNQVTETVAFEAANSSETKQGIYTATVASIIIGVLLAIGATIFCVVSVVRPIVEVGIRMRDISSGDGDLTQTLPVKGNDEIAYMGKNFNKFVAKTRGIISETISIAEQLQHSASALKSLSIKTSDAAREQQSGSQQIATALYEMTTSFQQVAQNAANAEETTNRANDNVKLSMSAVDSNRNSITHLAKEVSSAKEVIARLAEESQSVAGILSVIQGIAEQTNLLALNAAIEAARAGEQGRGFAVVADEVRNLAQKTQQSTSEIQDVINGLQSKSGEAVSVIENSANKAEQSVQLAGEVTSHLNEVCHSVEQVFQMNTQIATASEEQASVAEDINRNVTHINDISQQTASDAEASNQASESMNSLVNQLTKLVHQFKV